MNLLIETTEDIRESGHTPDDIVFIGSEYSGHSCTWDEFQLLANFEYDNGFGAQRIASDLIIVFKDGTSMWRYEYDGSESWYYSKPFSEPKVRKPIKILGGSKFAWDTLQEMNKR